MPLVFVHGVNVRDSAGYKEEVSARSALFQKIALQDVAVVPDDEIFNPYWGKYAAKFRWENKCLPHEEYQAFGSADDLYAPIALDCLKVKLVDPHRATPLLDAAGRNLSAAVDLLWDSAANVANNDSNSEYAELGRLAIAYADANPKPAWLEGLVDDNQFVSALFAQMESWNPPTTVAASGGQLTTPSTIYNSFGASNCTSRFKEASVRLAQTVTSLAIKPVMPAIRSSIHLRLSLFIGDILVYLDERDKHGPDSPIINEVHSAFTKAAAKRTETNPLIIVGHSMGGNISYDILSYYDRSITCDLFLTVGSQVGVFEELKRFKSSNPDLPSKEIKLVPKLDHVKRWINVFDPSDLFGYATSVIFEGSVDFRYDNVTDPISTHSAYFRRPHFHTRLNKRLLEKG